MKRVLGLAAALLLAACSSQPIRSELPPAEREAAEIAQLDREAVLRADPDWALEGRIAVSNGREGGSGRIDWRQSGSAYEVSLSAPVTRQSWRLSGDASQARLDGLEGGTRTGDDAGALLREATGWDIPVVALAEWVRGVRAQALGSAVVQYGANGLPMRIEQGGWVIEYVWPEGAAGKQALPTRLDARRGEARVKLVIDRWADAP
ncbi:lipoprotein insertase outer membrane protein LolB [Lysobacter korlensis]|uniref:Outer-membrane lipoprotein LolB n=1 Tax=Lysobacter korlensis TaxID=553636 RepID=A0ABV6RJT4_9GAMM